VTQPIDAIPIAHPDLADPTVLRLVADRLRERMHAERVVVYGSVARGEATVDSDIDLLIVAPGAENQYRRLARAHEAIRDLGVGLPLSPLVMTSEEVDRRLSRGDPFVRDILAEGVEL